MVSSTDDHCLNQLLHQGSKNGDFLSFSWYLFSPRLLTYFRFNEEEMIQKYASMDVDPDTGMKKHLSTETRDLDLEDSVRNKGRDEKSEMGNRKRVLRLAAMSLGTRQVCTLWATVILAIN